MWVVRAILGLFIIVPLAGAFVPVPGLLGGQSEPAGFWPPEGTLLLAVATFAFLIALGTTLASLLLFTLLVSRQAETWLRSIVLFGIATFFIPTALKAYAFRDFLLIFDPTSQLQSYWYWLWSLAYFSVFCFGFLLAFVSVSGGRSAIDALHELQPPLRRSASVVQLAFPCAMLGGLSTWAFTFFGGMDIRLLTDRTPVGDVLNELFGGRDLEAAVMSSAVVVCGMLSAGLIGFVAIATIRAGEEKDA